MGRVGGRREGEGGKEGGNSDRTNTESPSLVPPFLSLPSSLRSVSNEIKGKRRAGKEGGEGKPHEGGREGGKDEGWQKSLLKIDEEAATFRSYVDGSKKTLSPESSIETQRGLGGEGGREGGREGEKESGHPRK